MNDNRRSIPPVNTILAHESIAALIDSVGLLRTRHCVQMSLEKYRSENLVFDLETFVGEISNNLNFGWASLRPCVNGTGAILNTGLGRAKLSEQAARAVFEIASNHSTLEIDLLTGERGNRGRHVGELLSALTGCQNSLIVNNNAGSLILAVAALSKGKEVVISRGELIEIGGGFRLPVIISEAGGTLVEVGTTNRTYLSDYERALSPNTGMILKCWHSNFKMSGFVHEAAYLDIVRLAKANNIPCVFDMGSGNTGRCEDIITDKEPSLMEIIKADFDLVLASGDKLLGGPQAGLIMGSWEYVDRLAKHPFARALRIDKLSLAALETTLSIHLSGNAQDLVPALRYITRNFEETEDLAKRLKHFLEDLRDTFEFEVLECSSQIGGGAMPGELLPSHAISIRRLAQQLGPDHLAQELRQCKVPIITRIQKDRVLLDVKTIDANDFGLIHSSLSEVAKRIHQNE